MTRITYHEDDLVRRGDVITAVERRLQYGSGDYEDACLDILDALTGLCHPQFAIKAQGDRFWTGEYLPPIHDPKICSECARRSDAHA